MWLFLGTGTAMAQNNDLMIRPRVITSENYNVQRHMPLPKTEIVILKDSLLIHIPEISTSSLQPVIFSRETGNIQPLYSIIYTQSILTGKYVNQIQWYPLLGISEQIY